jgi:O-antigen ligase
MNLSAGIRQTQDLLGRPAFIAGATLLFGVSVFVAGSTLRPPLGGLALLLTVGLAAGAMTALLQRPAVFLVLFLLFATFAPFISRLLDAPLGWFKGIFFFLILPTWILSRVASPHRSTWQLAARTPLLCLAAAIGVFGILSAVSLLRGVPSLQVLNTVRGFLLYPPLMFIAMEAAGDGKRIEKFLWFVLGLTVLVGLGAVAQSFLPAEVLLRLGLNLETGAMAYVVFDPITGKIYERLFSILDDHSSVAAFSFVGIIVGVYLLITNRRAGKRLLVVLALGLNGYALLLTYNMTLLCGVTLFLLLLIIRRRSLRMLIIFMIVASTIAGIVSIRYGELIRNRLITSFSVTRGTSTSLVARIESNREALKMVAAEPTLGRGIGSTANMLIYYRLGMRSDIGDGFATDNFYMTTLVESGLIGLGALLTLHLLPLVGLLRLSRRGDARWRNFSVVMSSAVFVWLLMNFSNSPMNTNPTNLLYWSFTGFVWRISEERGGRYGPEETPGP